MHMFCYDSNLNYFNNLLLITYRKYFLFTIKKNNLSHHATVSCALFLNSLYFHHHPSFENLNFNLLPTYYVGNLFRIQLRLNLFVSLPLHFQYQLTTLIISAQHILVSHSVLPTDFYRRSSHLIHTHTPFYILYPVSYTHLINAFKYKF